MTTQQIETIDDPVKSLLSDLLESIDLETDCTAVKKLQTSMNNVLEEECHYDFAMKYAELLALRPHTDTKKNLAIALKQFPKQIVPLIVNRATSLTFPVNQNDVFLIGRDYLYNIDRILSGCERKLAVLERFGAKLSSDVSPLDTQEIDQASTSEPIPQTTKETKRTPEFLDKYEAYQISILEGEGGICLD